MSTRDRDRPSLIRYVAAIHESTGHRVDSADESGGLVTASNLRIDAADPCLEIWSGLLAGAAAAHAPRFEVVLESGPGWRVVESV